MRKLRFIWVDDQKKKVESYRAAIEAGVGGMRASIDVIEVKADILSHLERWSVDNLSKPPDLLIIDHIFNSTLPFGLKGSSVAHLLRSQFQRVPMVCVTAMYDEPKKFDQEDISEYTALFLYGQLDQHIEDLYAVARDFKKLHALEGDVRAQIASCVKAPKRDKEDLLRILPEEFMREKHATTEHRMARWIFNVLLPRPGFLYDRLHAATLLGLSETGFKKVEELFDKAKYRGVFATEREPRWWASELRNQLYKIAGPDSPDLPQHAGRSLQGVSRSEYSVCYVTKTSEPPPDAVVATDTTAGAKYRVVQRQYADTNPKDLGITPGFETRLILKKRSK